MSQGCALLILRSKGQRSRSWRMVIWKWFPDDNWLCNQPMIMKLHTLTPHESRMCPIDFGVKRSTVKVMAHGYLKMVHRNNGCRFEFVGVGWGPVLLQQYFQYAFICCPYMLPLLFYLGSSWHIPKEYRFINVFHASFVFLFEDQQRVHTAWVPADTFPRNIDLYMHLMRHLYFCFKINRGFILPGFQLTHSRCKQIYISRIICILFEDQQRVHTAWVPVDTFGKRKGRAAVSRCLLFEWRKGMRYLLNHKILMSLSHSRATYSPIK